MSINKEHTTLIDNYFDGQLSATEKANLESELSSDPLLNSEFEHQKEIVQGLQEFRKLQLKTRLEGIVINPGILGYISQSAVLKPLSYIAAGILVGVGVYFFNTKKETRMTYLETVNPYLEYDLTSVTELALMEEPLDYKYEIKVERQPILKEDIVVKSSVSEDLVALSKVTNTAKATFEVPSLSADSDSETELLVDEMAPVAPARLDELSDVGSLNKIEIENIITNKYKFHYKLENGRLYLYGKFDVSPYQILELNSNAGKKLFFQYNGNYFRLQENTRSITPLEQIEDSSVIDELEIIKSK